MPDYVAEHAADRAAGMVLMGTGFMAVLLFSGEQRVSQASDWAKRLLQGGLALTSVTKAFGDVLSYLRLFALGLASASLAMTFNELAGQVQSGAGRAGPYLAVMLLLLGHAELRTDHDECGRARTAPEPDRIFQLGRHG